MNEGILAKTLEETPKREDRTVGQKGKRLQEGNHEPYNRSDLAYKQSVEDIEVNNEFLNSFIFTAFIETCRRFACLP